MSKDVLELGTIAYAQKQDSADVLAKYKNEFHHPKKAGEEVIYFCGNSLGLQPKSAKAAVDQEMRNWKEKGVEGHFEGERPWVEYHKLSKGALAHLVGAHEHEVVCMNNLTTNIHLMLASFYRPEKKRKKVLIEKGAFPSDHFALTTFMNIKGIDAREHLIELAPTGGCNFKTEAIAETIYDIGDELALVLWPGIQYYSGQLFRTEEIVKAGHQVGAYVGFDLAHAIGNVPLSMHNDNADFAVWCSYKYLNSGPGNVSGIYIHENHSQDVTFPRLGGWWGQNESTRFEMENVFDPIPGADGWQLSNMNIVSTAAHLASLEIFEEAGIAQLRKKSLKLTAYLETLLISSETLQGKIEIITPSNPEERGCQLSLFLAKNGKEIFNYLIAHGVVLDWREPNVIRVAPTPLYNTFEEVFIFVKTLEDAILQYD